MTRTQGRVPPYVAPVVAALAQGTALVAAGLLITHPPTGWWDPGEKGLVGWLAAHRTPALTTASGWLSTIAFTPAIVAVTAVAALLLLLRHRWRPAALLAGAVTLQAVLFVSAAHLVDRARPDVVRLDGSLPTSSFPSGHVGAATALYGGLGLLALYGTRGRWRVPLCALAWLVPALVAASRLYRGMHHPTDVLFGLLNGAAALWVVAHALPVRERRERPAPADPAAPPRPPAALVHNPVSVDDALLERLSAVLVAHGYAPPLRLPGAAEDCGRAAAARALADGALLVAACGGDGTVTACAETLAGTGATLAVVPCGTGNLLARNLGLPTDPEAALTAALTGRTRRIDLIRAEGDGLPVRAAATMAGMGLDAAVMADTGRDLKRRLGWPAYLVGAARHLRDRRFPLTVTVDDAPPVRRQVRTAVVGNVGTLQGGVRLLPDAVPDDGLLDLVLVQPQGPRGWSTAVLSLLTGTRRQGPAAPLEHFRGRRIELTADRAHPRECDGDPVGDGRTLILTARPDALLVRVPATWQEQPAELAASAEPTDSAASAEHTEHAEAAASGREAA
ncbi:phosphatase PAP2 family protein [Kitasatospora sp. NA04385]|uniref:diacylglycerol kinase family protein n=1 Tax=Kitasatospora sp. NA04385 TaxID=2742135 RepID=UPI001591BF62|nr:diacylglycerol kinase family protein [Kitasatospora sp. NA04385]QKW18003.1 phosphatase PAP2 family protein [Kitasatospora sp. NA04385]